jgi:Xaa-Pro dipeptidase
MQHVCTEMLKEGVLWDDVHLTAHEIAIEGLIKLGILQGAKDDILKTRTSVAFFPHGLGHYLGMDTHDTGGHPDYEDKDPMFRYLRVRGTLPAGAIITVEPGVSPSTYMFGKRANWNLDLLLPIHHRTLPERSRSCSIYQFRCIE